MTEGGERAEIIRHEIRRHEKKLRQLMEAYEARGNPRTMRAAADQRVLVRALESALRVVLAGDHIRKEDHHDESTHYAPSDQRGTDENGVHFGAKSGHG